MIKPIKAICDPNSIVMNLISNWGDAIIIQHLCTILLPSSGRWFSSTVVLDLVDENGRVSYTCLPCLYYCQMTQLMQMLCLFFPRVYYFAVAKCWKLPCVFHQHCLSLFSSKQLSLCQFGVGLFSALFTHCIRLLSLCSRGLGEVGVRMR